MKLREFEFIFKDLPAFNLNDIRKFAPDFHRQQLSAWQDKGYVRSLAGGYYFLADRAVDEAFLFMMANKIYEPSYISLESALAYYDVIPESVLGITSVSSRKTQKFDSAWGRFSYRSVSPKYMFGYQVTDISPGKKYKMARLEKAVIDYLYLNSDIRSSDDFEGLRWNKTQLEDLKENPLFIKYLEIFNKRTLERRVDHLLEYLNA
jgi:predicted transcriptional regulator of viral defense system